MNLHQRPSRATTVNSTINTGNSPIDYWKSVLTKKQIDNGLDILNRFGLGDLYNFSNLPNHDSLNSILKK